MATTLQSKIYHPTVLPDSDGWTGLGGFAANSLSGGYLQIVDASNVAFNGYRKTFTSTLDTPFIVDCEFCMVSYKADGNGIVGPVLKISTGARLVEFALLDTGTAKKISLIQDRSPFTAESVDYAWDNLLSGYYYFHRFRIVIDPRNDIVSVFDRDANFLFSSELSLFDATTDQQVDWGSDTAAISTSLWSVVAVNLGVAYVWQYPEADRYQKGYPVYFRGDLSGGENYYRASIGGNTCYSVYTTPNITAKFGRAFCWSETVSVDRSDLILYETSNTANRVVFEDFYRAIYEDYTYHNRKLELKKHYPVEAYEIGRRYFRNIPISAIESTSTDPTRCSLVISAADLIDGVDLLARAKDYGDTPTWKSVSPHTLGNHALLMINGALALCSVSFDADDYCNIRLTPEGARFSLEDDQLFHIGDTVSVYFLESARSVSYEMTHTEAASNTVGLFSVVPIRGELIETYAFTDVASEFAEECFVFLNGSLLEGDTASRANVAAVTTDCALSTNLQSLYLASSFTPYPDDILTIVQIPGAVRGAWVVSAAEETAEEIDLDSHSADRMTHIDIDGYGDADFYSDIVVWRNSVCQVSDTAQRANAGAVVCDCAKKSAANVLLLPDVLENDIIYIAKMR